MLPEFMGYLDPGDNVSITYKIDPNSEAMKDYYLITSGNLDGVEIDVEGDGLGVEVKVQATPSQLY
jgi:hypothetical protein